MQQILENLTEAQVHSYDAELAKVAQAVGQAMASQKLVVLTSGGTAVALSKDGYEIGNFSTGNRGAKMAE